MKLLAKRLLATGAAFAVFAGTAAGGTAGVAAAATSTDAAAESELQSQILSALTNRMPSLDVAYAGKASALKAEVTRALNAALNADDYVHYTVKTYGFTAKTTSSGLTAVTFQFTYWETLEQTAQVKTKIAEVLPTILTTDMNAHEKEKAIHDWIVSNLAYDTTLKSHSAYDGLFQGTTVCQGYALIAYEMLRQAGIPVKIEEGRARGIAHAWNLVQLDGTWYQLDTTWDDPVPDVRGKVSYDYYNLTDAQLRVDHSWNKSYPAAKTSYDQTLAGLTKSDPGKASFYNNMYDSLGLSYLSEANTAANLKELTAKLQAAANNREQEITIRYLHGGSVAADLKKARASVTGIAGLSYTSAAYTRTTANDRLLQIKLTY